MVPGGVQTGPEANNRRKLDRPVEAVLFDMDGTLTLPILDFAMIKQSLGCPDGLPVLEWLKTCPTDERTRLEERLIAFEVAAAERATAATGAAEVIGWVRDRGLKVGIITRNCIQAVEVTLRRCGFDIEVLWTREDQPHKPSGQAVEGLCRRLGVRPERSVVVGDYKFDLEAARAAGAGAVLLLHAAELPQWADLADVVIRELGELREIL